jgi:hypothetical protein
MLDNYQSPEVFEIGRASEMIAGSAKVAPPPDQIATSNLSFGGDIDEGDE